MISQGIFRGIELTKIHHKLFLDSLAIVVKINLSYTHKTSS